MPFVALLYSDKKLCVGHISNLFIACHWKYIICFVVGVRRGPKRSRCWRQRKTRYDLKSILRSLLHFFFSSTVTISCYSFLDAIKAVDEACDESQRKRVRQETARIVSHTLSFLSTILSAFLL